ncbi:hypothetical protein LTR16_009983, partial [Cryomyces antarcticus]
WEVLRDPNPTPTASRSPNGLSCWVSARTWGACLSARPATSADGSVLATAPTTTFPDARGRGLHPSTWRFQSTTSQRRRVWSLV